MRKEVEIVKDKQGNKIVKINEIIFIGKRNIEWKAVEVYLQKYIGELIAVAESKEQIVISKKFVDEYAGSTYTKGLKGGYAKAKANAAQGIREMIQIASGKRYAKNKKQKHCNDAKFGWYYYDTRFALPVFNEERKEILYNCYRAVLIIQHSKDGRFYLYDLHKIKKEPSNPLSS